MRLLIPLFLVLAHVPAMASDVAQTQPRCESRDLAFDSKEVRCSFHGSTEQRRLRLTVNFSGGHDDTSAIMTLYLDDKSLVCDSGSKTSLMGEDGEVSLICLSSIARAPESTFVVRSIVFWSHAQYSGYELTSN